ncbi:hypothetical protein [Prochlorococcus marinus]|uniref:hypothetical protein n=1 Tax=Prochlorococcus marinus TaxID=1219 RepID=UPI0022B3FC9D|nr:hypothetical protein [Prochlorococcus marinus]
MKKFDHPWKNNFIERSNNITIPYDGWNYSINFDSKYFSTIDNKRRKKSYQYQSEPKDLNLELLELENKNKATSLCLESVNHSQIAIIGCGPVGMAASLWLKKAYPKKEITIYETRVDLKSNKIKPFSRRWLTYVKLDLLEPILNLEDVSLIKRIGLYNCIGIDIRNLEYALLRAINKQEISICQMNNKIPKPEILLDASGGRFMQYNQSKIIGKKSLNIISPKNKNNFGQIECSSNILNQFEIVDFGNIIKPFYNGYPLQVPFLKINYLPPNLKDEFIYFSNILNNDYGVYYWNGVMRDDLNHSLLFLSLFQDEFLGIDDLIDFPIRLDQAWDNNLFREKASRRLSIIFEWILTKLGKDRLCYIEPLFLWQPFLCLRKDRYISGDIEYLNIGDSHYIGNPKTGNGLANHLYELKDIFSGMF